MSFISPWFLTGLISIAIPIYLHLYHRKTPVLKEFPSLRLIKKSVEFVAHRQKMRNIILLIMRILLLFLLVMALARPFWGHGVDASTPSAFVVLLDNSMSMGSVHQGVSVFNNAKARSLEIIEQMQPGDRATVGIINDPGSLLFSQLTWDKNALLRAIESVQPSYGGTDLAVSLLPALELLVPLSAYRRTLYVVTDMTKVAWEHFILRYNLEKVDPAIDLVMVPVGAMAPENMAITSLKIDAPFVMKGSTVPLHINLANYSPRSKTARVTVSINSERKLEKEFELEPNSEREVKMGLIFAQAGMTHLSASIQADALQGDDTRHLALRVFEPCPVLLILPEPIANQNKSQEGVFVEFALTPFKTSKDNNFIVETRTADEAARLTLNKYKALILVNQRSLKPDFIKKTSEYLLSGGNIITFLGSNVNPQWYNKNLYDDLGSSYILPGRIFQRIGNAVSKGVAYQLTDIDIGHPSFKLFADEGTGDPSKAHIYEFFQVKPNPSALLLARMSRGLPAIVEEKRGLGRSMLINFTADTAWTNWQLRTTWVPFLHQTLINMVKGADVEFAEVKPGHPVTANLNLANTDKLFLKLPDGNKKLIDTQLAAGKMIHFTTRETAQVGYYELLNNDEMISAFVVNPPPSESKLERMNLRDIPRFIAMQHDPSKGRSVAKEISVLRTGYDLGKTALILLLLLVIAECWFANFAKTKNIGNI